MPLMFTRRGLGGCRGLRPPARRGLPACPGRVLLTERQLFGGSTGWGGGGSIFLVPL